MLSVTAEDVSMMGKVGADFCVAGKKQSLLTSSL